MYVPQRLMFDYIQSVCVCALVTHISFVGVEQLKFKCLN